MSSDIVKRLRDKTRLRKAHGLTGWVLHEEALTAEAADEIERLRAWQKDAIDRIKVYINICDHQRVTGEYMSADTCVYCALDRALIAAALSAADQPQPATSAPPAPLPPLDALGT